ncbi:unnamed protein product [Ascophyllum nodosum]
MKEDNATTCCACGQFCRQFGALVRKNALVKRRAWCQLLCELLAPAIFVLFVSAIKELIEVEEYGAYIPAADVPVVPYEVLQETASYPNLLCHDNNAFYRCDCHLDKEDVPIPDIYTTNMGLNETGQAMWGTSHSTRFLFSTCSSIVNLPTSDFEDQDICLIDVCLPLPYTVPPSLRFFCFSHFLCNLDGDVDEVCGTGTSDQDLDAEEYLSLISDTTVLLGDSGLSELIIPEDQIGSVCEPLTFVVMGSDEGGGLDEAAAFFDYVTTNFSMTSSHWVMYNTESEFTDIIGESGYSRDAADERPAFSVGIVFTAGSPDWAYTIRANITKADPSGNNGYWEVNTPDTDFSTENNCKAPDKCPDADDGRSAVTYAKAYHQAGVLMLQQLVDNWIMTQEGASLDSPPVLRVADFPNPQWQTDGFWSSASFMFPFLVVFAVLYPVANVISSLVKEKELRIKEGLKMMGLTDAAHTASWIFHFVILFFCTSILMVFFSGSLFENSDPSLIFLYFFLFFMASTSFCFFVASFFSRAKTASTLGTLAFFVALFPYFAVSSDNTDAGSRRAACLLPPTCLALGTLSFAEYEDSGEGVTNETAATSEDGFTFNDVLGMFFLDIILFAVLAWYFNAVLPSEWGTARKPWFLFTTSYWCPGRANSAVVAGNAKLLGHFESENRDSVEPVEERLKTQVETGDCVAIRGLTKEYKNSTGGSKLAVDRLDLTMYSGQVTALLGHNGAGKTTTIGMLTGMIPVTSGAAFVAGRDVIGDMATIRRNLGVCPQHDILYPDLTVREHLRMYAVLKGVPGSRLQETISNTLSDVGLTEKKNERTKTLSGGQKRKLSVGIALIGGSKVVFLDEPTSGMDPHSRRFTWDLIRKNRDGRVIVLTTHFMDEADLLGDRVAIMADGALRCCGSSLFLKNHYGVGYNLTIVRDIGETEGEISSAFENGMDDEKADEEKGFNTTKNQEGNVKPIKRLVRSYVREATLLSNVGAEVSFQLPNDASGTFEAMLTELDARKAELGITSYGMSVTTLEEVFLRVANGTADVEARKNLANISLKRQSSLSSTNFKTGPAKARALGFVCPKGDGLNIDRSKSLFGAHIMALLWKRLLTFKRDKKMWVFSIVMPAIFVSLGIIILEASSTTSEPAILLTPTVYNDGSAAFPYATQCTLSDTCDPLPLVQQMDIFGDAVEISLDFDSNANASDGVKLMNEELLERGWADYVYGAISFREADSTSGIFDYTVHSNYSGIHSIPTYVNQINTAMLRLLSGNADLSISVTIHPMPQTNYQTAIIEGIDSFSVILFILIAFIFSPASWIAYIVREKESKCKHQQVVSGVGLNAFWISSYVWDMTSLIPAVAFTLIVLAAAGVDALMDGEAASATALLFILYAFSMPSYTYLWSFLFKTYSTAQNSFLFHNLILGLIAPIAVAIMSLFEGTVNDIAVGLGWVLSLIPQFALGYGFLNISLMEVFGFFDDVTYTPLSMRITGKSLVYMAVCGVVYFLAVLVLERTSAGGSFISSLFGKAAVSRSLRNLTPKQLGDEDVIDKDVKAEMERVADGGADSDVVKVKNLRKVYPVSTGAKVAVKNTSLGIPRGECFGLLGINGAGKSSTLAILSGELPATTGSAHLSGFDVSRSPEAIHRLVGYCPQFDALFETLTGREHLMLYATIKGIPKYKRQAAVEEKIDEMGLRQYCERPAGGYSGGNKRKLSVAIAMIGDPQIVFLDEPSTGMDPMARRFMWNVIMRIVTENKECAMILTTHSMEECEALCQRIGIMVGGRLRCLGSSQHLKTRFGKGFQLEARVAAIPHEEIDSMTEILADATGDSSQIRNDLSVLRSALLAAEVPELESEITESGRGATVYHAFATQGMIPTREFAAWICVEKKCTRVIDFVYNNFEGAMLREKQNAKMRFEFPHQEGQTLAQMFGFIESQRKSLFIGEYALSQTSLEQVFNGFAAQQEEERGTAVGLTHARSDFRVGPETGHASSTRLISMTGPERLNPLLNQPS